MSFPGSVKSEGAKATFHHCLHLHPLPHHHHPHPSHLNHHCKSFKLIGGGGGGGRGGGGGGGHQEGSLRSDPSNQCRYPATNNFHHIDHHHRQHFDDYDDGDDDDDDDDDDMMATIRAGNFPAATTLFYSAEIVSALEYLHSLSIIYRWDQQNHLFLCT